MSLTDTQFTNIILGINRIIDAVAEGDRKKTEDIYNLLLNYLKDITKDSK